jgi:hypothetical protein
MGSTSVAKALEILGYNVVHHCPLTHPETLEAARESLYEKTVVSTGIWFGEFLLREMEYGQLHNKTIILEREWTSWCESLSAFPVSKQDKVKYQDLYVRLFFTNSSEIFYFDPLDGWEKLCIITGKEAPNTEFPRLNQAPQNWSI